MVLCALLHIYGSLRLFLCSRSFIHSLCHPHQRPLAQLLFKARKVVAQEEGTPVGKGSHAARLSDVSSLELDSPGYVLATPIRDEGSHRLRPAAARLGLYGHQLFCGPHEEVLLKGRVLPLVVILVARVQDRLAHTPLEGSQSFIVLGRDSIQIGLEGRARDGPPLSRRVGAHGRG